MKFAFSIDNCACLSQISDDLSISDGIFECMGSTIVEFGDVTLNDNLEVVFRIAESLNALDTIIDTKGSESKIFDFTFQFENRLKFICNNGNVKVLDKERDLGVIDEFEIKEAIVQRNLIIEFIEKTIAIKSTYLASRILKREIL